MISYIALIYSKKDDLFWFFRQAFLFGSSLRSDTPNDLDLLLVYEDGKVDLAVSEGEKIKEKLAYSLPMVSVDLTILSESELAQTKFLSSVDYIAFKS